MFCTMVRCIHGTQQHEKLNNEGDTHMTKIYNGEDSLSARIAHLTAPNYTVIVFEDGEIEQVTGQFQTQKPVRLFVKGERTEKEVAAALESGQQWLADSTY